VLGAGGMAGHLIALYLRERGHIVTGVARRKLACCRSITADAMDSGALGRIVRSEGGDAVVNCIGVLNRAVDERPCAGIHLNACLPHLLAEWTGNSPTRLVHLSSDCVFSGDGNGGHAEDDFRSADTMYGRSKALGEVAYGGNVTIRTSFVGPDMNADGGGLFNWFMRQRGAISGYRAALWSGVTSMVLARAVDAVIARGVTGLYHLTNNSTISKYELLGLFNELRSEPVEIRADDDIRENRSLVDTRRELGFVVPGYGEMAREMHEWMLRHRALYPHYALREPDK
jgi:dTDP-4-dehydrorhamnose reductase